MKTESFINSQLFRFTTFLIASFLVVSIFILAKSFLIPLAWGLLIALASVRMLDKIEYKLKLKRIVVTIAFLLIILLFMILLLFFFFAEVKIIVTGMPEFAQKISAIIHNFSIVLQGYGLTIPGQINQSEIHEYISGHTSNITSALSGFGQGISKIFLVIFYLFFLIYYRDNYLYYMKHREGTYAKFKAAKLRFNKILDIINNFLYGLIIVTLIMGVMLYVIFLLIGLKFALFFAVFAALLTLIPYLGNLIGVITVFIFAAVTNDGFLVPILAVGGIFFSNFFQESVFKPIIIGDKIKLNAFFIFLSVIIGGIIWGIAGMILFMPLVGIIVLFLEQNNETRPLSFLFTQLSPELRHNFHKALKKEMEKEMLEEEKLK